MRRHDLHKDAQQKAKNLHDTLAHFSEDLWKVYKDYLETLPKDVPIIDGALANIYEAIQQLNTAEGLLEEAVDETGLLNNLYPFPRKQK